LKPYFFRMVALLLIGSGPNLSVRFAAKTLSLGAILIFELLDDPATLKLILTS
jgi:hypothetical protein